MPPEWKLHEFERWASPKKESLLSEMGVRKEASNCQKTRDICSVPKFTKPPDLQQSVLRRKGPGCQEDVPDKRKQRRGRDLAEKRHKARRSRDRLNPAGDVDKEVGERGKSLPEKAK